MYTLIRRFKIDIGRNLEDEVKKDIYNTIIKLSWNPENIIYINWCDELYWVNRVFFMAVDSHLGFWKYQSGWLVIMHYPVHIFQAKKKKCSSTITPEWWEVSLSLSFQESNMAANRNFKDDFKTKNWYQKWIQQSQNIRKTCFTLVHRMKNTFLTEFLSFPKWRPAAILYF